MRLIADTLCNQIRAANSKVADEIKKRVDELLASRPSS
jgi:hypothetical protein